MLAFCIYLGLGAGGALEGVFWLVIGTWDGFMEGLVWDWVYIILYVVSMRDDDKDGPGLLGLVAVISIR